MGSNRFKQVQQSTQLSELWIEPHIQFQLSPNFELDISYVQKSSCSNQGSELNCSSTSIHQYNIPPFVTFTSTTATHLYSSVVTAIADIFGEIDIA
jgi:hypothetical protein